MKRSTCFPGAVSIILMIAALPAISQVELRFSPLDQHIEVGETGSLSVILDEGLDVRTIEVWVSYNETFVTSQGGQPGQIFDESGCPLFPIYEENTPETWYAATVTMGPTCFTTGPGELYRWNFEGLMDGICTVQVDSVVLYDQFAEVIENVSFSGTTIRVGDITSAHPPLAVDLGLSLAPNPFNPMTIITLTGPPGETATVEVFDMTGRRVATPWQGTLGTQRTTLQWNGIDQQSRPVPSGTYLFRVNGRENRHVIRKGILLK